MCLLSTCQQNTPWFAICCKCEYRLGETSMCVLCTGCRLQLSFGVMMAVVLSLLSACNISETTCSVPPCLFPTESSEEGFPHTPTSLQPSPDSSGRASVSSQLDSSHPPDYLCLSQCKTGSVSTSRYVRAV